MTTEKYPAYALELGDQIMINDNIYRICLISDTLNGYRLFVVDEDGGSHNVDCETRKEFRVLCDA